MTPKNNHFIKIVEWVVFMLVEFPFVLVFDSFSLTSGFSSIIGIYTMSSARVLYNSAWETFHYVVIHGFSAISQYAS